MKNSKLARVLSAILAITVVLCSMPISLGMTALAENVTVDYSTLESASKLDIEYYYSTLGMHDGAGLEVVNGDGVTVDADWLYQINSVDKFVEAENNAYAVYFIEQGTDFTAYFSDTTTLDDIKVYVSGNGVDWDVAQSSKDYVAKTISLIDQPEYVSYVKIIWPLYLYKSTPETPYYQFNALKSVDYTQGTHSANYKRINFASASGIDAFEKNGVSLSSGGVVVPDYTTLENATAENSYNGFVSYRVQPGTRFSLTVTNSRGSEAIGTKLGYENPLDYSIEIYVSSDNVHFTKLENVYTNSARHPNNKSGGDAIRSTDYNFIVPDDAVIVKCKFPMTQNLKSAGLWDYIGNDIMTINKVEYTALPLYDYTAIDSSVTLTEGTKDQYGVADATNYDKIKSWNGAVGYNWDGAYNNKIPEIIYNVSTGTHFSAHFINANGLGAYVAVKDYVLTLQGWSPEQNAWVNAATLTLTANDTNVKNAMVVIPAEENLYTKIKVVWPKKASDKACGEGAMNIAAVSFTQPAFSYDYTDTATLGELTADSKVNFGIAEYGNGVANSEDGSISAYIEPKGTKGGYIIYNVKPETSFHATFKTMNNMAEILKDQDFAIELQGYDEVTQSWVCVDDLLIERYTESYDARYSLMVSAAENKYSRLKIQWPKTLVYAWSSEYSFGLIGVVGDIRTNAQYYNYADMTSVEFSDANKSQFAISELAGTLQFDGGKIDPNSTYLANTGLTASVAYDVEPNSYFKANFKIKHSPNLTKYTTVKDYVLKLQYYSEDNTWVDLKDITIPKGTTEFASDYSLELTEAENKYSVLRILWPARVSASDPWNNGDDTFALTSVDLVPSKGTLYDYATLTDVELNAENKAQFGFASYHADLSKQDSFVNPAYCKNGVYVQYNTVPGTSFVAKFKRLSNLHYPLAKADYVMTIKGWDVETSTWVTAKQIVIPKDTDPETLPTFFTMRLSAEENDYTKIRIQWQNYNEDSCGGNYCFGLTGVTFTQSENYDYAGLDGDGVNLTAPTDADLQLTADNIADYGVSGTDGIITVAKSSGYIDPKGSELTNNGHAKCAIQYSVAKNMPFYAAFILKYAPNLNNYLTLADYVLTLEGKNSSGEWETVKTITIAKDTTHTTGEKFALKLSSDENKYSELRIHWPARASTTYNGDDTLAITEVSYSKETVSEKETLQTLEPLSYEKTPVETITATKVVLRPTINNVYVGDEVALDGLQVGLTYATGETRIVDYGFETESELVVGENTLVVTCRGAEVAVPVVGYCYMGDFNCDKQVDILDLVRLKKCSAGVAENEGASVTVNGDSTVAGIMVEFKKYLLDASEINFAKQWKGHANDTVDFTIDGAPTLEVINNYLSRTVNYNLGYTSDYYGGTFDTEEFYEGLGVILNVGGKYVQRTGGEWNMSGQLMSRKYDTIKECIEYAHQIDPELIFEASIFESVANTVGQIKVPAWVHEKFGVQLEDGVTEKSYTRADVLFSDEIYEAESLLENGSYQSTPDITKVEWQMLVYYRATQYIDLGYEAIHLGRTDLTGYSDTDNAAWAKVIGLIREYAAENARRGYVLINSHDDFEEFVYDGKHLVDFIMSPVRPDTSETETQLPSETDAQECVITQGYWGAPYGAGYSGVAPTGETYENYPYIVEFDNYGDSIPGGEENIGNPESYVWGLDEYSWYCNQPEWYKVEFLDYMLNELQTVYNDNGHISMPLGRGGYYDVVNGISREYAAVGSTVEDFVKSYFADQVD